MLFVWRRVVGLVEFENITTKTEELFYWLTILVSNTLGTALDDCVATTTGLGFERGALVFSGLLSLIAVAHFWSKRLPTSVAFWASYVLTRPLGDKTFVDVGIAARRTRRRAERRTFTWIEGQLRLITCLPR